VGLPNETFLGSAGQRARRSGVPRHSKWQDRGIIPGESRNPESGSRIKSGMTVLLPPFGQELIAIAKSFVRLLDDFSRVRIENLIYPGHGSVTEHAQPGECIIG